MRKLRSVYLLPAVLGLCCVSWADTITVDGVRYEHVIVRESGTRYYIQLPQEGRAFSVSKARVAAEDVVLSANPSARDALVEEWNARNTELRGGAAVRAGFDVNAKVEAPGGYGHSDEHARYGGVDSVQPSKVPLRDALKGVLRPEDLEYRVENEFLWVSSPERLRSESFEPFETRYYELRGSGASTLPKVVVRNPAGITGRHRYGIGRMRERASMGGLSDPSLYGGYGATGYSGGYGAGYGAAYGGGGYGAAYGGGGYGGYGAGYGGGGYGGYGAQAAGFGGAGGLAGGFGGGFGGGRGGFGGGGPLFSNISDLFFNIDDRLVGETPAIIGLQVLGPWSGRQPRFYAPRNALGAGRGMQQPGTGGVRGYDF